MANIQNDNLPNNSAYYHDNLPTFEDDYNSTGFPSKKPSSLGDWKKILLLVLIAAVALFGLFFNKIFGEDSSGWSDWTDQLPANVTADDYWIESKTVLLTTSPSEQLAGWNVYDTITGSGSTDWSQWSEIPVSPSATREVNTTTWYQYQDVIYKEVLVWNQPGEWVVLRESTNEHKIEETATVYPYYYFLCPKCGQRMPNRYCGPQWGGCGKTDIPSETHLFYFWFPISFEEAGMQPFYDAQWNGEPFYCTTGIDNSLYFRSKDRTPKPGYRYTTASVQTTQTLTEWSAPSPSSPAHPQVVMSDPSSCISIGI